MKILLSIILLLSLCGCNTTQGSSSNQITTPPVQPDEVAPEEEIEIYLQSSELSIHDNKDFPYIVHEVTCHNKTEYEIERIIYYLYYVDENNKILADRDTYQCIFKLRMEDVSKPMKIILFINDKAVRPVLTIYKIELSDGTIIDLSKAD